MPPLPPGFAARPVAGDPWPVALLAAPTDEPGSVFWNGSEGRCRAAVLFAPDRPVTPAMLRHLGLLALFDAAAGLAPPQLPIAAEQDALLVNGGRVATVRTATGADWALLGFDMALDLQDAAPGKTPGQTCLAEEGFEAVTPAEFLLLASRHMLRWLEIWREDGPDALARRVAQRTAPAGVVV